MTKATQGEHDVQPDAVKLLGDRYGASGTKNGYKVVPDDAGSPMVAGEAGRATRSS
jgi:hypothetical protein